MTPEPESALNTLGGMIVGAWPTLLAVSWILRLYRIRQDWRASDARSKLLLSLSGRFSRGEKAH